MSEDGERRYEPEPVLRLLFEYQGGVPRLVSRESTEMTLPLSPPGDEEAETASRWLELQAPDSRPLLRRELDEGPAHSREVFGPESLARLPTREPTGAFELLVPDVPGAEFVVLMERGAGDPFALDAPVERREVARYRLADVPGEEGAP